jgi:hypothetical protein
MTRPVASCLVIAAVFSAGCGEGDENPSGEMLSRLGLTENPSAVIAEACDRAAARSSLSVACPRIVPVGHHTIQYAGRGGGRTGPRNSYEAHLTSPSLRRSRSDPGEYAHWAFAAAKSLAGLRRGFAVPPYNLRACRRSGRASSPDRCEPRVRHLELNDVPVSEYRMPPYPTGGVHGGHTVLAWRGTHASYLLSIHHPADPRIPRTMAAPLIEDTRGD